MANKSFYFILTIYFVVFYVSLSNCTPEAMPSQESSSSIAFNSDGKGMVMVSCNGKTVQGEGIVACGSAAPHLREDLKSGYFMALLAQNIVLLYLMR